MILTRRMDRMLLLISSTIAALCALAQAPPSIDWQKALGGSLRDKAYAAHPTMDGGFVVVGQTQSDDGDVSGNHGGLDGWLIKLGPTGTIQWQRALGGSADDWLACTQQVADGGYIMAGAAESNNGNFSGNHGGKDFWVVKLNGEGVLIWQVCLGGDHWDEAASIQQTLDGGYIVAGRTASDNDQVTGFHGGMDVWVVKLDASGVLQWQKAYGGSLADEANSIRQLSDGGYIVSGFTYSNDGDVTDNHGSYDYWILKLDATGTLEWQKTFGGSESDEGEQILPTVDGGFVVTGNTSSGDGDVSEAPGNGDMWVLKLDNAGELLWERAFGGTDNDYGRSIVITDDGHYVMAGYSGSADGDVPGNQGDFDYWVIDMDESGTPGWSLSLGGGDEDELRWMEATSDGGYIVSGATLSTSGDVTDNHGDYDVWLVKLNFFVDGIAADQLPAFSVSPNPAFSLVRITAERFIDNGELWLTDATGRIVLKEGMNGITKILDLEHLAAGCYTLNVHTGEHVSSTRLLLE